jgi:hypothetical protein
VKLPALRTLKVKPPRHDTRQSENFAVIVIADVFRHLQHWATLSLAANGPIDVCHSAENYTGFLYLKKLLISGENSMPTSPRKLRIDDTNLVVSA